MKSTLHKYTLFILCGLGMVAPIMFLCSALGSQPLTFTNGPRFQSYPRALMVWAFGPRVESTQLSDFPAAWNKRWGQLHHMRPEDSVMTDMAEVSRLYYASLGREVPPGIIR